jgi:cytochrome c-type biogenesis protein CcsB
MEGLSHSLFLISMVVAGSGAVLYLLDAIGVRMALRQAVTNAGTMNIVTTEPSSGAAGQAASFAMWTLLALLTATMATRWLAAGRPPFGNMYEFNLAFAQGGVMFYAFYEVKYRQRALGAVLLPLVLALLLLTEAFFPDRLVTLVPALQKNRILTVHVATLMASYAALSVSFASAILYLAQGPQRRFARLPGRPVLEEIGDWSVMIGFPLLALGVALGAWWANSAWGRYWGWDPKETSSLVTWLVYAVYLHARHLRGWRGPRSAWLLIAGYMGVIFTYFVVNLWVAGLHSYAGV